MSHIRYHQTLQAEIEDMAGAFFSLSPEERESVVKYARGRLIATDALAVLSEPVPVRVLGSVPVEDVDERGLRETIAKAWDRESKEEISIWLKTSR